MTRKWIPRKSPSFDSAAVDLNKGGAYPIFRGGPAIAIARRELLRLLTGYTLMGLPLHCGIDWLAGHSLGVATAAVLITVAATLAVAVARWLGLEDLLQRLPLLLVLGLAGVGLVFVTSLPSNGLSGGGAELLGTMLILITTVSVLGSLYRPLAASYQAVTQKVPFRDLCVAAAAMLVSLAFAGIGQVCPRLVPQLIACVLASALAGLVVVEYAAWARANPTVALDRVIQFDGLTNQPSEKSRKRNGPIDGEAALKGAALFGISYGVFATIPSHGADWLRLLPAPADGKANKVVELLAGLFLTSLFGMPLAWTWTSSALSGLRVPKPFLAARVAWDALAVFLTYPEVSHPLSHRLHTAWVRPLSVRLSAAFVVLISVATSCLTTAEKPKAAELISADATARPPETPPRQVPRFTLPEDGPGGGGVGWGGQGYANNPFSLPPPAWVPPPVPQKEVGKEGSETRPVGERVSRLFLNALTAAVAGPVFLYLLVLVLGVAVLPTYYRFFESPQLAASAR